MAGAKEIRTKIASIKSTQKITGRHGNGRRVQDASAQDRMNASRPYAEKMLQVIRHLAKASPEYHHSFMAEQREVKRVGYIVVSSDRGLCGGLNSNLFRKLVVEIRQNREKASSPSSAPSAARRSASSSASAARSRRRSRSSATSRTSKT
jgi:F-type H+-transporting ATPase subunit gamma